MPRSAKNRSSRSLRSGPRQPSKDKTEKLLQSAQSALSGGNVDTALRHLKRLVAHAPDHWIGHAMLASIRVGRFEFARAEASLHTLLKIDEGSADAWRDLGNVLRYQGRCEEALNALREALRRRPDFARAHSDLILTLNYLPDIPPETILAESRTWNDRYAALLSATTPMPAAPRPNDGRIRVGYLSPDLRTHSVSYFFEPLLAAHDRDRFTVFCYAEVAQPDDTTDRLKGLADGWRWTAGQPDDAVAETIRSDGIQILIDLAGHSPRHRLPVLARRPAPVQVTWLGYPATTGLSAIGYRFTDAVADPPGLLDRLYSEQLVRLPGGFLCYAAPPDAPPVAAPSTETPIHSASHVVVVPL